MSAKRIFLTVSAFAVAVAAAGGTAWYAADYVERSSRAAVARAFSVAGLDWTQIDTDGLQLVLSGRAPDEPARFRAVTKAGEVVDPRRIVDAMEVEPSRAVTAPRFSLEILRNDADVSVIGLVPAGGGRELLVDLLGRLGNTTPIDVTNMVETADYMTPEAWDESLRFAITALGSLPRAKISVEAGAVTLTAVADSDDERRALERDFARARPASVELSLDIAAPRPVVTPFTLRFVMPKGRPPRFEACAVDTEAARARVRAAAEAVGFAGQDGCRIALGVPSSGWAEAAALGIGALERIGGGALTLSDADVSLVAPEGAARPVFDTVVAELDAALPELFVLSAVLPEPTRIDGTGDAGEGPPEFVATLSPEGQVQLRGRLFDAAQQAAVASYGRALFGVSDTYMATRQDSGLPRGWPARVLAGMDALSRLANGAVIVQPELVVIRGVSGDPQAEAVISGLLSDKLGAEADFRIEVSYDEELDPLLNIPTPQECETRLNAVLMEDKLSFAPGEAVIEDAGEGQVGRLAEMLSDCRRSVFEIGGHTDSQGREESNLALSVGRADAVRAALISRGVPPGQIVARGYGEAEPIADNDTEAGREANRRITFTLLGAGGEEEEAPDAEADGTAEAAAGEAPDGAPDQAPPPEAPDAGGDDE